jgi:prephenate dehydrogenase
VSKLIDIVKLVGAIPLILDPIKHDRAVAGISHLPQMMASGLVDMISKEDNAELSKTLSAGGFRDMTRIASSQYRMWEDIVETNKDNIFDLIDSYIAELHFIKDSITNKSLDGIFENARNTRELIQKGKKGLLQQQLFEIFVRIPDEPGMIFKISTILAEQNLNIKDISIQHSREQDGGQFRLGFASSLDSEKAVDCLTQKGYFAKTIE